MQATLSEKVYQHVRVLLTRGELSPGQRAIIVSVDDTGPAGRRLLDLGLLPGTPVRALRHAPFGDPGVYELRGYRLCLRRTESGRVQVRRG